MINLAIPFIDDSRPDTVEQLELSFVSTVRNPVAKGDPVFSVRKAPGTERVVAAPCAGFLRRLWFPGDSVFPGRIVAQIEDEGAHFDATTWPDPDAPEPLAGVIGHEHILAALSDAVAVAARDGNPLPHVLLVGIPGLGQDAIVRALESEVDPPRGRWWHVTRDDRGGDAAAMLVNLEKDNFLFLEGLDRLSPDAEEILLTALADRQVDVLIGQGPTARSIKIDLHPFSLIATAEDVSRVHRDLRPLFGLTLHLTPLSNEDVAAIMHRAAIRLGVLPDAGAIDLLVPYTRGNPKIGLRILRHACGMIVTPGADRTDADGELCESRILDSTLVQRALDQLGVVPADTRTAVAVPESRRVLGTGGRPVAAATSQPNASLTPATIVTPDARSDSPPRPRAVRTALDALVDELNALVGLGQVKQEVQHLVSYLKIDQVRRARGLRTVEMSRHMVFEGNPGTGKTKVARLLARIYRDLGILAKGHLVERDRSGLVGGFVGQTALKVRDVVDEARGGVLFIDEAHTLAPEESQNDFGREAIDTIVKLMEDHRDDLVVIVAGYPERMSRFLRANPGLESRFNKRLIFEDYTALELSAIFRSLCHDSDYRLLQAGEERLAEVLEDACAHRDENFGNARLVRNLFEKAVERHASRVAGLAATDADALTTLTADDIAPGAGPQQPLHAILADMNHLVGLRRVMSEVAQLFDFLTVEAARRAAGLRGADLSLHMAFVGNPGTGKTTVARLIGRAFHSLGVISKGHLVEADRSRLVAGYVGQTALKTEEVVRQALGGVLLIDEAYSLTPALPGDFGAEAIATLLKLMEDYRHDLVVIAAGYPDEIQRFLQSNPGLQSRFSRVLTFEDYDPDALLKIFLNMCHDGQYLTTASANQLLGELFRSAYERRDGTFANGRFVRTVFEQTIPVKLPASHGCPTRTRMHSYPSSRRTYWERSEPGRGHAAGTRRRALGTPAT